MLTMAGVAPGAMPSGVQPSDPTVKRVTLVSPIEAGILDLRSRFTESDTWSTRLDGMVGFIKSYKIFFLSSVAVILFVFGVGWYIQSASVDERGYEVTIQGSGSGAGVTISSEELEYDERKAEVVAPEVEVKDFPAIKLVNQSGINGLAAELRLQLEAEGYPVIELTTDFGANENNTVIVYPPEYSQQALELSQVIEGSLLSAFADAAKSDTPIVIYVGRDLENEVQ